MVAEIRFCTYGIETYGFEDLTSDSDQKFHSGLQICITIKCSVTYQC
jgi:hypothetical protein